MTTMTPDDLVNDANNLHRQLCANLGDEFAGKDAATCVAACMMLAATVALHSGLPPGCFRSLSDAIARQHERHFIGERDARH
jgi:hypothetical protein